MSDHWYVLYVSGGKERGLVKFLMEHGLFAFTPLIERMQKKDGIYQSVTRPMFPNYVFIKTPLTQVEFDERLFQLRQMKTGIVKQLLYDRQGTSTLLPKEQHLLECLMDENSTVKHSIGFIEGDAVFITKGPLRGMESEIVKIDRHKRIAYLRCEMMGRPVKISLEIVEKI